MTESIVRALRLATTATLSTLAVVSGGRATGIEWTVGQSNVDGAGSVSAVASHSR
jgi:hypothetical protein